MTLIEHIKRLFHIGEKADNDIEPIETTDVSIIDTSDLEIDRNLTDDENESRKKLFEEISSGNFSTFIIYGNDIARKTNHYMDIVRKRLNQNIEENKTLSRNVSLEQAIRQKVKIIFNNAEIDSILNDLSELKRNCEIRIIALEDLGNAELKKSKRRIFFMSDKTDASKINSINNAISRLSAHIKIINMLSHSVRNEQLAYYNENNTLNTFLSNKDEQESKKIANRVLGETFKELKSSINAIATFSNIPALVIDGESLDKLDMDKMPLDKKVEVIALSKRYLDLYVAENREKLLSQGGLLDRAKEYQSKLWEEIESDYLDVPLWAKKIIDYLDTGAWKSVQTGKKFLHRYYYRIGNLERLISVFVEEIPEDFKEEFYKTKFYFYALFEEASGFDSHESKPIETKSEEERKYYLKFITEIVDKIHRESEDGKLLRFMDKHLSLKNANDILDHCDKFVALLRIEKYGRDGLFTLILRIADFKDGVNRYCCLDQINPKYLSKNDLQIYQHNSSTMAKDILTMWKSTENLSTMYNGFWGDYNDGWDFAERVKDGLYPRSSPEIYGIDYSRDYIEFLVKTIKEYNKSQREANVPLENRFYFDSELNIRLHIGQYMAMFSYLIEKLTEKNISKESVLAQIELPNGKLENGLNYSNLLRKILPDLKEYMHNNLSEIDCEMLYKKKKMREDYIKGTVDAKINFYRLLFKNYKADDGKVLGKDFNYDKYKYYKSIIELCKNFYKFDIDGWFLTDICLKLDKEFGKENVRDDLLKNYLIRQSSIPIYNPFRFLFSDDDIINKYSSLDFYSKVSSLTITCQCLEKIDIENINVYSSIKFFLINRLFNKEILENDEEYRIALYIVGYYMDGINGGGNYKSILDDGFGDFYKRGTYKITGSIPLIHDWSGTDFTTLTYAEKRRTPIPKDYQKVYELYKRIRDVFKSTDNMQEILCPDLVKVIMTEDFYKRLGKSYDENKKIRPEILFEGYRKNAEVKDNRENTAKSDDDLDL